MHEQPGHGEVEEAPNKDVTIGGGTGEGALRADLEGFPRNRNGWELLGVPEQLARLAVRSAYATDESKN